jgi:hypothetical protein
VATVATVIGDSPECRMTCRHPGEMVCLPDKRGPLV